MGPGQNRNRPKYRAQACGAAPLARLGFCMPGACREHVFAAEYAANACRQLPNGHAQPLCAEGCMPRTLSPQFRKQEQEQKLHSQAAPGR